MKFEVDVPARDEVPADFVATTNITALEGDGNDRGTALSCLSMSCTKRADPARYTGVSDAARRVGGAGQLERARSPFACSIPDG